MSTQNPKIVIQDTTSDALAEAGRLIRILADAVNPWPTRIGIDAASMADDAAGRIKACTERLVRVYKETHGG